MRRADQPYLFADDFTHTTGKPTKGEPGAMWNLKIIGCAAVAMLAISLQIRAQDAPDKKPADTAKQDSAAPKKDTAAKAEEAKDQPVWDPQRAEKDLEVGQYYMKRGDIDAAIDRFEDAILAKPGYALPYRYLGDAQEKHGMKRQAIKSYTKYLDLYPRAEDAAKIHKRIEKLWAEVEKGKK
jgi:tetratricopeptide (TPR) repeat protein